MIKNLSRKLLNPGSIKKQLSTIRFKLNRFFHEKMLFRIATKEKIFASIWRNNYWGSDESLSGPGSTLEYTVEIRGKLPSMFDMMGIKSIFDAPCGDMHWMQALLKETNFNYLGGDIVAELISKNKIHFTSPRVDFIKFDITADKFPDVDVWLCRSVFYHLSNYDIYQAIEQFCASNIKYILTTNHITDIGHVNKDIATGDWRLLDLTLPPFNFSSNPLWQVNDYVAPHPPATLTLWTKEQIEEILPTLRKIYHK
jgi:hypothetical protein